MCSGIWTQAIWTEKTTVPVLFKFQILNIIQIMLPEKRNPKMMDNPITSLFWILDQFTSSSMVVTPVILFHLTQRGSSLINRLMYMMLLKIHKRPMKLVIVIRDLSLRTLISSKWHLAGIELTVKIYAQETKTNPIKIISQQLTITLKHLNTIKRIIKLLNS